MRVAELAESYFAPEEREWRATAAARARRTPSRALAPLPPFLMLHLKRFYADPSSGATRKLRTPVAIDPYLSLGRHVEHHAARDTAGVGGVGGVDGDDATYRLRALVVHHGETSWAGHYTCAARLGDSDQWVTYDDKRVTLADGDPTRSSAVLRGGYLLLYERCAP